MKRIALILLALVCASSAHAQDYAKPGWPNLARTLVRFGALSLSDDKVIDDYAAITECDLYKGLHQDDFKWNKVRIAIRDSVKQNIAMFPTNYSYDIQLQLDHYDFTDKEYKLTDKTAIRKVNTFLIYQNEGGVCGAVIKNIPWAFRAVLDTPVSFEGLPLDEKDAQTLLEQMKANRNPDKIVYTRFNLRIVYIEPLRRAAIKGEDQSFTRTNAIGNNAARLDAHLDSIDFYEDQPMTKLIYTYRP